MPTYERLDYGSPDGSHWGGASTDALGMYGVTPVTRYTADFIVASTFLATGQSTATASTYGFTSLDAVTTLVATVSSLVTAARNIGMVV